MRMLFDDWKARFKKYYRNPTAVRGCTQSHTGASRWIEARACAAQRDGSCNICPAAGCSCRHCVLPQRLAHQAQTLPTPCHRLPAGYHQPLNNQMHAHVAPCCPALPCQVLTLPCIPWHCPNTALPCLAIPYRAPACPALVLPRRTRPPLASSPPT